MTSIWWGESASIGRASSSYPNVPWPSAPVEPHPNVATSPRPVSTAVCSAPQQTSIGSPASAAGSGMLRGCGKSRAASPVFVDYMQHALVDLPRADFSVPDGIVFARIDRDSGLLAAAADDDALFQPFRDGTVPQERAQAKLPGGTVRPARLD